MTESRHHFDPEWKEALNLLANSPERVQALDQAKKAREDLVSAMNAMAKTHEGVVVFRHLCKWLDFKGSSITLGPNGVDINGTIYNEARRKVWIDLRELLDVDHRNNIEKD